ncbi:MAG: hypothetical protein E7394_06610 [Ruminococcaceae bacterium]|nr:hypothetical protein [Oscillospiraceae bacterium]
MNKPSKILSAFLILTLLFSTILSSGQIISYADSFAPIEGVGDVNVTLPMSDVEGTLIYSKSNFDTSVFSATTSKQLDPMIYHDKGTSSTSSDSNVFVAPKQAYFTLENSLNEYISENGEIDAKVHEVTFEMKSVNADVYLYPCGNSNNRDAKASLVFAGTRLTNDYNGQTYGNLPQNTWYEIKFTHDIRDQKIYVSINGAVVYSGTSTTVGANFKSILYQQNDGTTTNIDNIRYVVKGVSSEEVPETPDIDDEFTPVDGVGDPDATLPREDEEGISIYQKSDFDTATYTSNGQNQLDAVLYNDRGSSSVVTDGDNTSFKFGSQGYMTFKNALDAYTAENGSIDVAVHEVSFSIKYTGANIYLYPCGVNNNRDASASLVIIGTRLTNDYNGQTYGNLPANTWYRVKFTYDAENSKAYVSVNNALVYSGTSSIIGSDFRSILYQHGDGTNAEIDDIVYIVKGETSSTPPTPPPSGDEDEDDDAFAPVPGVGDTSIEIPLYDIDGTVIYSNGEFSSDTYVASSIKQLDPILYHEIGTSSVGADASTGSVFSFGKQGYFTPKNALDAYVAQNGSVPGAIHEITFDIKITGGSVYLYPCGGGNSRDAAASMVFNGSTLTNDNDGANYGTVPTGKWYKVKFTLDTISGTVYSSLNGVAVYAGASGILSSSLYSVLYQQSNDATVFIDNITYSVKGSTNIESVTVDNNIVYIAMNDELVLTPEETADFTPFVALFSGEDEVELSKAVYDSSKNQIVLTAKKPLISATEYKITLSDELVSVSGINVRENYEYTFKTDAMAFDVTEVKNVSGAICATVVNLTGTEKSIVMVVAGKNENGAITSIASTPKTLVGSDGATLSLIPSDDLASSFEVFFIESWETSYPVKGGICKPYVLENDFVNATHILTNNSIKISGIMGDSFGTHVTLNFAEEASVKDGEIILEHPFSDDNKPMISYITVTGADGAISEELILPDTVEPGSYYLYAVSRENTVYVNVYVLDSDEAGEVLAKFNEETSASVLKSYMAQDGCMEKIGFSSEKVSAYYEDIAQYTIYARQSAYTLDTLRDAINRSIALAKAKNGEDSSKLMSEYASSFGGTYDDYSVLDSNEKSAFSALLSVIDYQKDGVSLELNDLITIAKGRASTKTWSQLKKYLTNYKDALGINMDSTSTYGKLPLKNQPEVFSGMLSDIKNVTTIKEIKDSFDSSVTAVKKKVNSNKDQGSSGGGGGGGSYDKFNDITVEVIPTPSDETTAVTGGYSDTHGHFSMDAVKYLSDMNIINGYGDGTFRPNNSVTRSEFAKMIATAFLVEANGSSEFSDVNKSDWYYDCITALASNGILLGDDGKFRPNEFITRQDATLVVSRVLSYLGQNFDKSEAVFTDEENIASYAKDAVSAMKNAGIVVGSNGMFYPTSDITRGEAAVIVCRALNIRLEAK